MQRPVCVHHVMLEYHGVTKNERVMQSEQTAQPRDDTDSDKLWWATAKHIHLTLCFFTCNLCERAISQGLTQTMAEVAADSGATPHESQARQIVYCGGKVTFSSLSVHSRHRLDTGIAVLLFYSFVSPFFPAFQ